MLAFSLTVCIVSSILFLLLTGKHKSHLSLACTYGLNAHHQITNKTISANCSQIFNCYLGYCQAEGPFVSQSASISENEEPPTLHVFWWIHYEFCDWTVWVVSADSTLYPFPSPEDIPIAKNSEYSVTLNSMCDHEAPVKTINMNVSLSLLLNSNVIEHVPYIMCVLSRIDTDSMIHYHGSRKVYLRFYLSDDSRASSTTQARLSTSTQETQSLVTPNFTLSVDTTILSNLKTDGIASSASNILSSQAMHTYLGALFCLTAITLLCCLD